ncbi:MAG: transcriptional regulator [Moraxellaceae bacterium]|jgi:AraC-like DNA-binding protein|nr:transcriptional regulator [Moraxellaceae bacterium]
MEDIPLMPVVYIHRLAELMAEEGLDADSVLRESGISPNLFRRPDSLVTLRQALSLATRYMGLSSHPLPALRFGQRMDLITHGLLGHVYCWRGDFRGLIESIAAYLQVRLPMLTFTICEGRGYFGVKIAGTGGSTRFRDFLEQATLGSLHALCSPVARNIMIHCRHDFFSDPGAARQLLQTELNSDHDCTELRFYANAQLNTSLPPGDPLTAATQDPFEEPAFVVRLRNELLSHQQGRDCAENIASALGMSVRTLRRRLAEFSLNFNSMRADVRMQVAMRYLTTTHISIDRIATLVGYSDQAAFTRAFRQWKGETPAAIRQQRARHLHVVTGSAPDTGHDAPDA